MKQGSIIMIAGIDCDEGKEEEFNKWYNSTFPRLMVKAPGVVRVDRYERIQEDPMLPKFLSVVGLESEEFITALANSDAVREIANTYVAEGIQWGLKVRWALHYRNIYSSGIIEHKEQGPSMDFIQTVESEEAMEKTSYTTESSIEVIDVTEKLPDEISVTTIEDTV